MPLGLDPTWYPDDPRRYPREYPEWPDFPGGYPVFPPGNPGWDFSERHPPPPRPPPEYGVPPNQPGINPDFNNLPLSPLTPSGDWGTDPKRGVPSANRPSPVVPAQSPFVFGAASPAPAPAPRPRRRPARRRTRRPVREPSRPSRPAPPRRPPPVRVPEPVSPDAPAPRPGPRRSPIRIPVPVAIPAVLFDLWKRLFDEYLQPHYPYSRGPRNRRGPRVRQPGAPPRDVVVPSPGPLPVDLPHRTPTPEAPPSEIFQPTTPLPSPFPDPSVPVEVPTPTPYGRPQPVAPPAGQPFSLPSPLEWLVRQVRPRDRRNPRRDQPRDEPSEFGDVGAPGRLGDPLEAGPLGLTPLEPGRVDLPEQEQDPCRQAAREKKREQRKKRKKCKEFVTKEIKVCRSS